MFKNPVGASRLIRVVFNLLLGAYGFILNIFAFYGVTFGLRGIVASREKNSFTDYVTNCIKNTF